MTALDPLYKGNGLTKEAEPYLTMPCVIDVPKVTAGCVTMDSCILLRYIGCSLDPQHSSLLLFIKL